MTSSGGSFLRDPRDIIVALRLLVLAGLAMLGLGQAPEHSDLFWSTTIVYGLSNLAYMASGAQRLASAKVQRFVFLFDVLVVSALIVMRGANVPEFFLAYFTLVLMAAIVQGVGSAALNALVVCTIFGAVSLWGEDPRLLLNFRVLAQFVFLFIVSIFMSHLAEAGREHARVRARIDAERKRLLATVKDRNRDLSESTIALETANSRLAAADHLATIGTVAAGVAHDIRNPVAALRAALEEAPSLLDELGVATGPASDAGPLLRAAVADAKNACDTLQRLAADLTTLARTTPAEPVDVPCRTAIEATHRLLRHRIKPPLAADVRCTTDATVVADPGRLQQVLLNLGSNALDAMETGGGTLTLCAERVDEAYVRFEVSDTGIGMTDEVAAKALDGFFTTKPAGKGTGLGLHLVREIVRAHGARMTLDSKPGVGTTFLIDWPAGHVPEPAEGERHEHRPTGDSDRGRRGEHPSGARAHAPV